MSFKYTYKGVDHTVSGKSTTLTTQGKYCEDNITIQEDLLDNTVKFISNNNLYELMSVKSGNSINAPYVSPNPQDKLFIGWGLSGQTVPTVFPYIPTDDTNFNALFIDAELPSEYQEVEYLEATGTQYIKSNWNPDLTINCSIQCKLGFNTNDRGMLMSNYGAGNTNFGIELYGNRAVRHYFAQDVFYLPMASVLPLREMADYTMTYTASNALLSATCNNVSGQGTVINYARHIGPEVYLFTDASLRFKMGMIGRMVIKNPYTVHYYIPCYRKDDSVAGMYDLVTSTFLTNNGTGTFIVGPDVN